MEIYHHVFKVDSCTKDALELQGRNQTSLSSSLFLSTERGSAGLTNPLPKTRRDAYNCWWIRIRPSSSDATKRMLVPHRLVSLDRTAISPTPFKIPSFGNTLIRILPPNTLYFGLTSKLKIFLAPGKESISLPKYLSLFLLVFTSKYIQNIIIKKYKLHYIKI